MSEPASACMGVPSFAVLTGRTSMVAHSSRAEHSPAARPAGGRGGACCGAAKARLTARCYRCGMDLERIDYIVFGIATLAIAGWGFALSLLL
jgi:hypothetical protein